MFQDSELISIIPNIRRYAISLTKSRDLSEDLLQSSLEKAIKHREKYDPNLGKLIQWCLTITYRIHANSFRSQKRDRRLKNQKKILAQDLMSSEDPEQNLIVKDIVDNLSLLDPIAQEIIQTISIDGLSYKEAAEKIQVPIGTIRSRLFRARASFHQMVN